ncbi:hypothetical protein HHI36_009256 [Cryptolaemus montrouzieri]|uniref:Uncharacterized protein n=1 Tax=Cryptolaemus montrouzieri TaxID=559131 RepID=A0ABD2MVK4_9CUCU
MLKLIAVEVSKLNQLYAIAISTIKGFIVHSVKPGKVGLDTGRLRFNNCIERSSGVLYSAPKLPLLKLNSKVVAVFVKYPTELNINPQACDMFSA